MPWKPKKFTAGFSCIEKLQKITSLEGQKNFKKEAQWCKKINICCYLRCFVGLIAAILDILQGFRNSENFCEIDVA
jgi:hypothetical protein